MIKHIKKKLNKFKNNSEKSDRSYHMPVVYWFMPLLCLGVFLLILDGWVSVIIPAARAV